MEEVRRMKTDCILVNPEEKLWRGPTKNILEVRTIFHHIMSLKYEDKPNYGLIRENLKSILTKNLHIGRPLSAKQAQNMLMLPAPFDPKNLIA